MSRISTDLQSRVQNLNRPSARKAVSTYRAKHTKFNGEMKKGMLDFLRSSPGKRKEILQVESQKLIALAEDLQESKAKAQALAHKIEIDKAQILADEKTLKELNEKNKAKHTSHAKKFSKLESLESVVKEDLFDCAYADSFTEVNSSFAMLIPEDVETKVTDKEFGYKVLAAIDSAGVDMHPDAETKTDLQPAKNWTKEETIEEIKRVLKISLRSKYEGGVLDDSSDDNDSPKAKKSKSNHDTSSASAGVASPVASVQSLNRIRF